MLGLQWKSIINTIQIFEVFLWDWLKSSSLIFDLNLVNIWTEHFFSVYIGLGLVMSMTGCVGMIASLEITIWFLGNSSLLVDWLFHVVCTDLQHASTKQLAKIKVVCAHLTITTHFKSRALEQPRILKTSLRSIMKFEIFKHSKSQHTIVPIVPSQRK